MADEERGGPHVSEPIFDDNEQQNKTIVREVRAEMANFWKEHSLNANEEEMMLDTNADILGRLEIPEILTMLPNFKGKDVLELGAGIGRFTGHIGVKAKSLIAVDFMENFICRNEADNGHLRNVKFLQADVTYLDYPPESFDLVFSNWLLMYLEQNEVKSLFARIFDWLRPGGFFFFRESCFHQSGNRSRDSNPSQYRKPSTYNDILRWINLEQNEFSLRLILSKSVQSYIEMKNNRNQICWLVQKVVNSDLANSLGCRMFEEHFANSFTPVESISSIEKHLGGCCVTSGEAKIFEKISPFLRAEANSYVLNVGSGLGWMSSRLAQEFNLKVHGVDPSANMVALCLERANILKQKNVQFQMGDLCHLSLSRNEFNLVLYCSSSNVDDHQSFFGLIKNSMKEGASMVVVDYCLKDGDLNPSLWQHIKRFKYHLLTTESYKQVLMDVGFEVEREEDLSLVKLDALNHDIIKLQGHDTVTQMLKGSMTRMIKWVKSQQLKLACFVCHKK